MKRKLSKGKVYMNFFISKELGDAVCERAKKSYRTISGELTYLMEIALKVEEKSK